MATGIQVVMKAREYLNTPFMHQTRIKDVGLDCVGLILSVAEDLGIKDKTGRPLLRNDHADYGPQPVRTLVLDTCDARLERKPISEIKPGDVVCLRTPADPTHVAIVSEFNGIPYIIHAYDGGTHRCIEHILNLQWRRRIVAAFKFGDE